MTKGVVQLVIIVGIVGMLGFFGMQAYNSFFGANPDSPEGDYSFIVESGDDINAISEGLLRDDVAQDSFVSVSRLYKVQPLFPGKYDLELPATTEEIIEQINEQSVVKAQEAQDNARASKAVTIKEGTTVDQIADILEEEGVLESKQDFLDALVAPGLYQYAFLPEPLDCEYGDRLNCVKYYYEGFMYPDTYEFFTPSTPDEVTIKFLNNFEAKVWNEVGGELTKTEFDKAIILASVMERETGRSNQVTDNDAAVLAEERAKVASVFYNRLGQGIPWSSDPTVNYGIPNLVCQQTVDLEDCVFLDDPRVQSQYNTYNNPGYPIGPITNPQLANVVAALNPAVTDYLFFVADLNGVTLFAETNAGHEANIVEATRINQTIN